MHKLLIDTSTLIDIRKAIKKGNAAWAQNTLRHLLDYRQHHPKITVSGFTVFEFLDGLHRNGEERVIQDFRTQFLPTLDVIYPDQDILTLGAEINAALAKGQSIGVVDTLIAATAISQNLILVSANTKHFARVQAVGFNLDIQNWREA